MIQTGANLGYAGGNNVGIRHALADKTTDAVWILNNDIVVEPTSLSAAWRRLDDSPDVGLVGSTICYEGQRDIVQSLGGGGFSRLKGSAHTIGMGQPRSQHVDAKAIEAELAFVHGAATLASRAYIEEVGLMTEDYFLYWEELDWAMRGRDRFSLGYAPNSIVYHRVGSSIGTSDDGFGSPLSQYYLTRNRVKFCCRHSKISLPFVALDMVRKAAGLALQGRWDRAVALLGAASNLGKPPRPRPTS